jgi:hypothetical protein
MKVRIGVKNDCGEEYYQRIGYTYLFFFEMLGIQYIRLFLFWAQEGLPQKFDD